MTANLCCCHYAVRWYVYALRQEDVKRKGSARWMESKLDRGAGNPAKRLRQLSSFALPSEKAFNRIPPFFTPSPCSTTSTSLGQLQPRLLPLHREATINSDKVKARHSQRSPRGKAKRTANKMATQARQPRGTPSLGSVKRNLKT